NVVARLLGAHQPRGEEDERSRQQDRKRNRQPEREADPPGRLVGQSARVGSRPAPITIERPQPTSATTIAPRKAAPKSATWKPRLSWSLIALVSSSIAALMTSRNRPSVRTLIGRVRMRRIGRMYVFSRLKASATSRNFHHSPLNVIPPIRKSATYSAPALTRIWMMRSVFMALA